MALFNKLFSTVKDLFTEDEEEKKRRQAFQKKAANVFSEVKRQIVETPKYFPKSPREAADTLKVHREFLERKIAPKLEKRAEDISDIALRFQFPLPQLFQFPLPQQRGLRRGIGRFGAGFITETFASPARAIENLLQPERLKKEAKKGPLEAGGAALDILGLVPILPVGRIKALGGPLKVFKATSIADKGFDFLNANFQTLKRTYQTTFGKNLLNADDVRQLFKPAGYTGVNSAEFHEASSALTKELFKDRVSQLKPRDVYLFTAGGSGNGKTTALKSLPKFMLGVKDGLDSNLSSLDSAIPKIEAVLQQGAKPRVVLIHRDPIESFVNGVIKRAVNNPESRVVPLKVAVDNFFGSMDTFKGLVKKYGDKVEFGMIDNSQGVGNAIPINNPLEFLEKLSYNRDDVTKQILKTTIEKVQRGELAPELASALIGELKPQRLARGAGELLEGVSTAGPGALKPTGEQILKIGGGTYHLKDLSISDEVFDFISGQAKKSEDVIREGRRGVVSFQDTRAAADKLGLTVDQLKKKNKQFTDAEIVAGGDILKTLSEGANQAVKQYQGNLQKGLATDMDRLNLINKITEQSTVLTKMLGAETELGRALNATKILKQAMLTPSEENVRKVYQIFKGRENVDAIANLYSQTLALEGEEAAYKFVRSLYKPKAMDYLTEYWYNSILSAPSTHIINSITNTLSALISPMERGVAAGFDLPRAIITRKPRERYFGEATADVVGGLTGLKEGLRKGFHALLNGYRFDDATKFDINRPEAFLAGSKLGAIKPTRWLVAADEFFKAINYSADLHATAYRTAQKEGLRGVKAAERVAELINNPTPELMDSAGKMAKYRVFQEEPGKITGSFLRLRNKLGPLGTFLAPFVSTPVNLVKFGTQRSPLGFVLNAPFAKGAERSDALARATIGSMVAGGLALYAMEGMITGAPPRNPGERDAFYRSGKQPYSIKIGDKWVSYQRLEPFNQAFTQVAAAHDAFVNKKEAPTTDKIMGIATQIGRNLISQTYLQGLNSILQAIEEPERYAGNFLENVASGFVPAISALRTATRIVDPTVRDPDGLGEAIRASIPGLSFTVLPRRNVFGEEIKRESPFGNIIGNVFPIKVTKEKQDVVDKELERLGLTIGYPQLTKFEKAGGERGREAGDQFLKESGGYMKEWLYNFTGSEEYKNLNDEERVKAIEKIKDLSRDEYRSKLIAIAYLFNESQKDSFEERQKLFNKLYEDGVITQEVGEWIEYLRNSSE